MTSKVTSNDKKSIASLDDSAVVAYLRAHPDFFEQHESLVEELKLPHLRSDGHTVSLVERQVEVLRERAREPDVKFRELIDIGHANVGIAEKMHRLSLGLIHARDPLTRFGVIERSLRDDFAAGTFVILLHDAPRVHAIGAVRGLRHVDKSDENLRAFESLYHSGKPRCGQLRDAAKNFLFPAAGNEIGSIALVALGAGGEQGLLAIGSPDLDRFNPTMGTEYLARIGEMIAMALV